jgi:hypothetical protein
MGKRWNMMIKPGSDDMGCEMNALGKKKQKLTPARK